MNFLMDSQIVVILMTMMWKRRKWKTFEVIPGINLFIRLVGLNQGINIMISCMAFLAATLVALKVCFWVVFPSLGWRSLVS